MVFLALHAGDTLYIGLYIRARGYIITLTHLYINKLHTRLIQSSTHLLAGDDEVELHYGQRVGLLSNTRINAAHSIVAMESKAGEHISIELAISVNEVDVGALYARAHTLASHTRARTGDQYIQAWSKRARGDNTLVSS